MMAWSADAGLIADELDAAGWEVALEAADLVMGSSDTGWQVVLTAPTDPPPGPAAWNVTYYFGGGARMVDVLSMTSAALLDRIKSPQEIATLMRDKAPDGGFAVVVSDVSQANCLALRLSGLDLAAEMDIRHSHPGCVPPELCTWLDARSYRFVRVQPIEGTDGGRQWEAYYVRMS